MPELISPPLVALDEDLGSTSEQVIRALAERIVAAGHADDVDGLLADAMAREAQSATGLPGGIGIPHCRSEHVTEATLAFARLSHPPTSARPTAPPTWCSSSPPLPVEAVRT